MSHTLAWFLFIAMQLSTMSQLWYAMLACPEYFDKGERARPGDQGESLVEQGSPS